MSAIWRIERRNNEVWVSNNANRRKNRPLSHYTQKTRNNGFGRRIIDLRFALIRISRWNGTNWRANPPALQKGVDNSFESRLFPLRRRLQLFRNTGGIWIDKSEFRFGTWPTFGCLQFPLPTPNKRILRWRSATPIGWGRVIELIEATETHSVAKLN